MNDSDCMVIKVHGDHPVSEPFESKRLMDSIEAACLGVGLATGLSEDTARQVTEKVQLWLANRPEVTSEDIRRIATKSLTIVSPEAAYLYKHHHTML